MANTVKKISIAIMAVIFIATICLPMLLLPTKVYADGESYEIGDTGPAGGIIIFVDGNLRMEVAPSDQSTGIQWYNGTYITIGTGLEGTWIGHGDDNTQAIVAAQGAGSYAAKLCYDLVITNNSVDYDDWFLPSDGAMYWFYANQDLIFPGLDDDLWYWSSSEKAYPSDEFEASAWQKNVFTNDSLLVDKADSARVRAVRFFEIGDDETENGDTGNNAIVEIIEKPWVRNVDMTCYQVLVNDDNDFEFVFWWEYADNNWVKIYDMAGNEVFSTDMPYGDAHFNADLPDGMYTVKTFHNDMSTPLQEFVIGKP